MNHIFKSVWSKKTGSFVAVSENAKSGGKKSSVVKAAIISSIISISGTSYAGNYSEGEGAGVNVVGDGNIAIGTESGVDVGGNDNISIGTGSGTNVVGNENSVLGSGSGSYVGFSIGDGPSAGDGNSVLGSGSGNGVMGDGNSVLGSGSGNGVGSGVDGVVYGDGVYGNSALGSGSGNDVMGDGNSVLGSGSGNDVQGDRNNTLGTGSGNNIYGDGNNTIGNDSGANGNGVGDNNNIIGNDSGADLRGDDNVIIGNNSGKGLDGGDHYYFPESMSNIIVGNNSGEQIDGYDNSILGNNAGNFVYGSNNATFGSGSSYELEGSENSVFGSDSGNRVFGDRNNTLGTKSSNELYGDGNNTIGNNSNVYSSGDNNNIIGNNSGNDISGSDNIVIGNNSGGGPAAEMTSVGGLESFASLEGGRAYETYEAYIPQNISNIILGNNSGENIYGSDNSILGNYAGNYVYGSNNAIFGSESSNQLEGSDNSNFGSWSGAYSRGDGNSYIGNYAGVSVTGSGNTFVGDGAGSYDGDSYGNYNTFVGSGAGAGVNGDGNIAIGEGAGVGNGVNSENQIYDSIAIGGSSKADSDGNVAIGQNSYARGFGSIAIGENSYVAADNSLVMGNNSYVSLSDVENLNVGYRADGSDIRYKADGVVSIGSELEKRRIINLADGNLDSDAVNVGQLKTVQNNVDGIKDRAVVYDGEVGSSKDTITLAGADGTTINNVRNGAINEFSNSAVTGNQLYKTNSALATYLGGGASFNSVTGEFGAPEYIVQGGKYNNVGSAFEAVDSNITDLHIKVDDGLTELHDKVDNGTLGVVQRTGNDNETVLTAAGGTAANPGEAQKLGNLADGKIESGSKEAINGGQLNDTNNMISETNNKVENSGNSLATNLGGGANYDFSTGTISAPEYSIQGGKYDNVGSAFDAVDNDLTNLHNKVDNGTLGVVQRTGNDNETVLTAAGGTAANPGEAQKLGNLADGKIEANSKEAVNGGQINNVGNSIANGMGGDSRFENGQLVTDLNVGGEKFNNVNDAINAAQGFKVTDDAGNTSRVGANGTLTVSGDKNISVAQSGKDNNGHYNVTLSEHLEVKSVTSDEVRINNGPTINQNGIDMNQKRITNVANGINDTDAVNVRQLDGIRNEFRNEIGGVRRDMNRMDKGLRAGVASAMATASMPQSNIPGKSMLSMGAANWKGEQGIAIGVSKFTEDGKYIFKFSGNASSRGDYGGSIGAGFHF